jgi:hypothetical protein
MATLVARYLDLQADSLRTAKLVSQGGDGVPVLVLADGEKFAPGDTLPVCCRERTAADFVTARRTFWQHEQDVTDRFTTEEMPAIEAGTAERIVRRFTGE